ncbi:MAG TPA: hypothetical protein VMV29_09460 [Ktedonobacterales bacterium]|nr:hypothetical protein [Ktedonobacterales bacterium]
MRSLRDILTKFGTNKIALLAVVVVVGALATSGWLVYRQRMSSSTATPQTAAYLDITEWSIKFPLSSSIKDAYYMPNIHGSYGVDGRADQMLFGLKSLDSHGCAAANDAAPALLFRTSPSQVDPVSGDVVTKDYPGVTVGSYFYGYSLTRSTTCQAATTFQKLDAALKIAVKGIVPDTSHK